MDVNQYNPNALAWNVSEQEHQTYTTPQFEGDYQHGPLGYYPQPRAEFEQKHINFTQMQGSHVGPHDFIEEGFSYTSSSSTSSSFDPLYSATIPSIYPESPLHSSSPPTLLPSPNPRASDYPSTSRQVHDAQTTSSHLPNTAPKWSCPPCTYCGKSHDRFSRARDCEFRHRGVKPYQCGGKCGLASWFVHSMISPIISDQSSLVLRPIAQKLFLRSICCLKMNDMHRAHYGTHPSLQPKPITDFLLQLSDDLQEKHCSAQERGMPTTPVVMDIAVQQALHTLS